MTPKISIVLPCYNGASMVGRAIESVINQSYKDWELIIVNDCSTDNTLDVAESYAAKDKRIRVFSNETNSKLPATLNHGFREARGEYWTWTSDDNILQPTMLEELSSFLDCNPDVGFIAADYDVIDPNDKVLKHIQIPQNLQKEILLNDYVGACFMYRQSVAELVGEYREDLFLVEDYEYWIRMSFHAKIASLNVENLYLYRVHPNSLTATRQKSIAERLVRMRLMHLDEVENVLADDKKRLALFYYRIVDNLQGKERWHYYLRFARNNFWQFGIKYLLVHYPHRFLG